MGRLEQFLQMKEYIVITLTQQWKADDFYNSFLSGWTNNFFWQTILANKNINFIIASKISWETSICSLMNNKGRNMPPYLDLLVFIGLVSMWIGKNAVIMRVHDAGIFTHLLI